MLPRIWQSDEFSWEGHLEGADPPRPAEAVSRSPIRPCTWRARRPTASTWRPTRASACCLPRRTPRPSSPSTSSATGPGSAGDARGRRGSTSSGATTCTPSVERTTERRASSPPCPSRRSSARQAVHPRPHQRLRELLEFRAASPPIPKAGLWPVAPASDPPARAGGPGGHLPLQRTGRGACGVWPPGNPSTPVERGIILAGYPDSCIKGVQLYEDAGVDQVILITQTETIPHERALSSIEMFGKHVIPACRTETPAKPVPAGAR